MISARLINDLNCRDGAFNMAADHYIAEFSPEADRQVIFRVYNWTTPTISLGAHQKSDAVVLPECEKRGWDVVFRPTGGRILLHEFDLSYSIIMPIGTNVYDDLHGIYNGVAEALIAMLKANGVEASNTKTMKSHRLNDPSPRARLCMGSRTRGEVHIEGRKISGAAQRIYEKRILQHGSIPLKGDVAAVAGVTPLSKDERSQVSAIIRSEATTLASEGFQVSDIQNLAEIFTDAVAERFQLDLLTIDWTAEELVKIKSLEKDFSILKNHYEIEGGMQ